MTIRKFIARAVAHSEVPAVIADSVPLVRLSEALARAGLIGRHDVDRGVLVIEPADIGSPVTPPDRARTRPDGSPYPTHL